MPEGEVSIAAKSTLRRVFASALGLSSSNDLLSTAKLSAVSPYKYDASESGPHLIGKPMDVYGAMSLQATTALSADEASSSATLSTPVDVTTRTNWAREKKYAGSAFVVGQGDHGMAAPLDITKTQRVIAVADATQIDVGDYLHVGDEMMYVESVDGNYIGVQRGAAVTTATAHKSMGEHTADDNAKQYTALVHADDTNDDKPNAVDAVAAHGWVTIWKRDTQSVYGTTATAAGADIVGNAAFTVNDGLGDGDKGYIMLKGGTASKEFISDVTPDGTATLDPV